MIDKLIQDGFLNEIGIFIRDYNFSSPSTASSVVMKTANNGWITWKNKDGKTLDEIVGRNNKEFAELIKKGYSTFKEYLILGQKLEQQGSTQWRRKLTKKYAHL